MTQILDRVIHVRFDGRSEELPAKGLDLTNTASDMDIKRRVASHFQLPASHLDNYVVVHNPQAIIIRPEAIYG